MSETSVVYLRRFSTLAVATLGEGGGGAWETTLLDLVDAGFQTYIEADVNPAGTHVLLYDAGNASVPFVLCDVVSNTATTLATSAPSYGRLSVDGTVFTRSNPTVPTDRTPTLEVLSATTGGVLRTVSLGQYYGGGGTYHLGGFAAHGNTAIAGGVGSAGGAVIVDMHTGQESPLIVPPINSHYPDVGAVAPVMKGGEKAYLLAWDSSGEYTVVSDKGIVLGHGDSGYPFPGKPDDVSVSPNGRYVVLKYRLVTDITWYLIDVETMTSRQMPSPALVANSVGIGATEAYYDKAPAVNSSGEVLAAAVRSQSEGVDYIVFYSALDFSVLGTVKLDYIVHSHVVFTSVGPEPEPRGPLFWTAFIKTKELEV